MVLFSTAQQKSNPAYPTFYVSMIVFVPLKTGLILEFLPTNQPSTNNEHLQSQPEWNMRHSELDLESPSPNF